MQPACHRRRLGRVGLVLLGVLLVSACGRFVDVTPIGRVELPPVAETSVVLGADGSLLTELHAEQDRDVVPLSRVPEVLRAAVISVEDTRFYAHGGVDARAIARAVRENAEHGRVVQGGSTITQQLAKNAITGSEQTLERKLTEASLALQLEAEFTKDEILEQYLNTVYFGNGAYGVQTAARRYFGVDVSAVTLSQAALLAGLLKAPATYDPYGNPQAALQRRNLVLSLMAAAGRASPEEAAAARETALEVAPPPAAQRTAPYFVAHVLEQLQHAPQFHVLGEDPVARAERIFRGGLRIETTLDRGWQRAAEAAVAQSLAADDGLRAALVAIDPATGSIRAMVGGRDFFDADDPSAQFNLATKALRQPGSTFKVLVLAAALAQGRSLDDRYPAPDRISIPPRPPEEPGAWEVGNYGGTAFGDLTLRQATAFSVNVVYAQLMEEVGPAAVARLAEAAGVRRVLPPRRSLALGAVEVTPLELASVQATLAAGGVYRTPTAVLRITAANGDVLWERPEPTGERVMDEAVAWLTTTALGDVVAFGTGERANLHRPMAGKTGTTQEGADAWFAGYTPDLAAAVWLGFPEGRVPMVPPRTTIRVEGGNLPAELFARFGTRALADIPAHDFPIPEVALTTVRVDTTRNCLPNPYTPPEVIAERAYLTGTEPTELCTEPTGPPTTDVPSVVGLPLDVAVRTLHNAGFTVEERSEFSIQLPPGFVVRQSPPAGREQLLSDGYTVTVYISVADRSGRTVPDVLNLPIDEGRALLEDAGFVVEVRLVCPDDTQTCTGATQRPGQIWQQDPDAGQQVPGASVVRLFAYPA
jgi:membrane peptidoglycan carboxypeptidase